MNVPAAFDWPAVLADVRSTTAVAADAGEPSVLVEGLSLFADHPGAAAVRGLCQRHAMLCADDAAAYRELRRRKWGRSHFGKPSYQERGVSEAEYGVYWEHYVWPAWVEHSTKVPAQSLRLDCLLPIERSVEALLPLLGKR